jgi:hypothetical protein
MDTVPATKWGFLRAMKPGFLPAMKQGFLPARKPGLSYGWKHPLVLAGAVVDGITETRHLTLPKLETATMTVVEVTVTRHLKLLDI